MQESQNSSPSQGVNVALSFTNTDIAFKHLSDAALKRSWWVYRLININLLVKIGPGLTTFALKIGLPVKGIIKATIFRQFCGGESITACKAVIDNLHSGGVGTILDYSIEGEDDEAVFDATCAEIIRTIDRAAPDPAIPITVFKPTGVIRFGLLEKLDKGENLSDAEQQEWSRAKARVDAICRHAAQADIPVMIDAEESWIQNTIDALALDMMQTYNSTKAVVYQTYQLYRHDKLASLKADHQAALAGGFTIGAKLVRGAYMEKERERAATMGYASPIQPDKQATDQAYNDALAYCIANLSTIALVAGTHNEHSCRLLADLLDSHNIDRRNPAVYFAQLLGMSDNLSFNLVHAGYKVAKYVPYGPVEAVLPYLFRRAEENTAIAGQMSRELALIDKELKRRKG